MVQTMTIIRCTRASFVRTTCSCWKHWTSNAQICSVASSPTKFSVQWRETTSRPSRRRSDRTRSYCQCSVASLLNSSNCSSTHWTTVDSSMSVTSSRTDQVWFFLQSGLLLRHHYATKCRMINGAALSGKMDELID